MPNWLPLEFRIVGGPWFDMQQPGVEDHRLELDMEHGTLSRRFTWQDAQGRRTKVVQRRFVSREDEHLAGLETEFTAENWSNSIQIRSGLDGRIVNAGVKRYRDLNGQHLTILGQTEVDKETIDLQVETNQSRVRVALTARTRVLRDGEIVEVDRSVVEEPGFIAHDLTFAAAAGAAGDGREDRCALYLARPRDLRERPRRPLGSGQSCRLRRAARAATSAPGSASGTGTTSRWTAPTNGPRRCCTCTSFISCKPSRHAARTWMSGCRREVGTGRRTEVTSSGMSCSFSRISTFSVPGSLQLYSNTGTPDSARLAQRHAKRASRARCFPGRAAPTDGRKPKGYTSTRYQDAGCPIAPTCSAMSISRSRITCGSTTWSAAASPSCASPAPSCSSRSPGSGPASPRTTARQVATRSTASWGRTSTTMATRVR